MGESMQTQLNAIYPKAYKPLIERTWLWIKDQPGLSSAEIARDLKEKISHVSSILTSLKSRGMVCAIDKENARGRTVAHFTVERRMGGEYVLWPKPHPVKQEPIAQPAQEATPLLGGVPHPTSTQTDPLQWVEHLTWKELRLLTARLNQVMSSL